MRFAIDTNVLVYGFVRDDQAKHAIASSILLGAPKVDAVLPVQVLGEFLNVIRRKHPKLFEAAIDQAARWQAILNLVPTTEDAVINGARLSSRHRIQLWDAIILHVAQSVQAVILLTEDLQDGFRWAGLRAVDPFTSGNRELIDKLLAEP